MEARTEAVRGRHTGQVAGQVVVQEVRRRSRERQRFAVYLTCGRRVWCGVARARGVWNGEGQHARDMLLTVREEHVLTAVEAALHGVA